MPSADSYNMITYLSPSCRVKSMVNRMAMVKVKDHALCRLRRVMNRPRSEESGLTLIEVVISVALMSILGLALLQGLSGVARGQGSQDERVGAVIAGRAQLESVKRAAYDTSVTGASGPAYASLPSEITASGVAFNTAVLGQEIESGVQLITVVVKVGSEEITRLQAYKVNR